MFISSKSSSGTFKETTINIREDLLARLGDTSVAIKKSRSWIISKCVRKFIKQNSKDYRFFSLTSFQPKTSNYKTLHVMVNLVEYDQFYDLRKSLKLSFSFIVFKALSLYLSDFKNTKSESVESSEDEYRLDTYKITINEAPKRRIYSFTWEEG